MNAALLGVPGGTVLVASSVMIDCLKGLYGTAKSINDFLNEQIEEMKSNDNPTIARTAEILEQAKVGFGIGFSAPTVVIAAGQLILGNPLSAAVAVATVPLNPISMTCAAVGAIYYGWNVLTEKEKEEIITRICHGLQAGAEFVKSVIQFVIQKSKEAWNSEHLVEIRKFIAATADAFGKTLGDVTKKLIDKIACTYEKTKKATSKAVDATGETISGLKNKLAKKSADPPPIENPVPASEEAPPLRIKVKINNKGQITIPAAVRRQLELASEVELLVQRDTVTLNKICSSF